MTDAALTDLLTKAKKLVDAVQMDDTGMMVGKEWMGGNGGLLSVDTIKAADELRKAIEVAERGTA